MPYRQQIPRPEHFRLGPPPPFGNGALLARRPEVADVRRVLSPVSGLDEASLRSFAAVLVPLAQHDEGLSVLLTRRSSSLDVNPGHLAFPGGWREPGEELVDAAVRETFEEVGIAIRDIEVLGTLGSFERGSDSGRIAAFVGLVPASAPLHLDAAEVDVAYELPLADISAEEMAWEERWGEEGAERSMAFFASERLLGDDLLWGLTARVLWDLLARLVAA